jgi:hypothetical protein
LAIRDALKLEDRIKDPGLALLAVFGCRRVEDADGKQVSYFPEAWPPVRQFGAGTGPARS